MLGPWVGVGGKVPFFEVGHFMQFLPQRQNEVRLSLQGDTNISFPFSVHANSGTPHHRYKRC